MWGVVRGVLRVDATGTVETQDLPAAGDLSTWVWDKYRLESGLSGKLDCSVGSIEASRNTRTLIAEFSRRETVATDTRTNRRSRGLGALRFG